MREGKIVLGSLIVLSCLILLPAPNAFAWDLCIGLADNDQDVDGTDAAMFKSHFGRSVFSHPCPSAGPSLVAKTGQITKYDGMPDDGYFQAGLETAEPTLRFIDHGDGTVTDTQTGLMWTKDADYCTTFFGGGVPWSTAFECAFWMRIDQVYGYDDWRMPNTNELQSLVDYGQSWPAIPLGNPFLNVADFIGFWSSTTDNFEPDKAWVSSLGYNAGHVTRSKTGYAYRVWNVRGLGGAPVDTRRFTDNMDGTITDNDTGLMWLKDLDCDFLLCDGGLPCPWGGAMEIVEGLEHGLCGLADDSNPGDWHLPTKSMWEQFICTDYANPPLCNTAGTGQWTNGDPFMANYSSTLGGMYSGFWTSTTQDCPPGGVWVMNMIDNENAGLLCAPQVDYDVWIWPVRDPLVTTTTTTVIE